jgi:hypothetical protein
MRDIAEAVSSSLGCPEKLGGLLFGLVDDGTITRHVNRLLEALLTEAAELRNVSPATLVLIRDSEFVFYVRRIARSDVDRRDENRDYLFTTRSNAAYVLRGGEGVRIRRYALPPDMDLSVFRPGIPLALVDETAYRGGVMHEAVDDGFVYDYVSAHEFAMVRIDYVPFADQTWHFDRDSLLSVFPSAAHVAQSTLVCIAKALGALQAPEALPHLLAIASHKSHFVRWAAIQAIAKVDREAAFGLLEQAAADPHPHVQSMARKVLAQHGRQPDGMLVRA